MERIKKVVAAVRERTNPRVVAVAGVAAIGLVAALQTFAYSPVTVVEGETMQRSSSASVANDSQASGGQYLRMPRTGTATTSMKITQATNRAEFRLRGDQCKGAPRARVEASGTAGSFKREFNVGSRQWETYVFTPSLAPGTYTLKVSYLNNYSSRRCNRNLFVDKLTFLGDGAVTPTMKPTPKPSPTSSLKPSPTPKPTSGPAGPALFRSDFESGTFGGWYVQSLKSRVGVITSPAFRGKYAARFEVRDGDVEPDTGSERSEVSLGNPMFDEGEDLYFRDAIYIPQETTIDGNWEIIQQLHEDNWPGSPGMAVFLDSGPSLRLGAGDGSPTYWSSNVPHGRWQDLVYRVKLSRDSSVGFVEVWLNGQPQTLKNGQTRMYGQTIQAARTYLKAGIYRSKSHTGTSIIYHDQIVVGRSMADVMAD